MLNGDRKAVLDAAAVLLKNHFLTPDGKHRAEVWDPHGYVLLVEGELEQRIERAKRDLECFRESRAFRMALDLLLPGWFDIDLSDHITTPQGHGFVSNDPQEWFDHMISVGIDEEIAKKLLSEVGHPLREGAS